MSEHGWNDPPQLSYQSLSGSKKPTTSLTKRVAHTTAQLTEEKKTIPSLSPSPPPHVISLAPPPQSKGATQLVTDDQLKTSEEVSSHSPDEVVTHLETMLDNLQALQKRVKEDIKKRITILSKQYRDGRVSTAVHQQMNLLVKALAKQDYAEAERIHVSLMVEHISEVNQWMIGIKKMVDTAKQLQCDQNDQN